MSKPNWPRTLLISCLVSGIFTIGSGFGTGYCLVRVAQGHYYMLPGVALYAYCTYVWSKDWRKDVALYREARKEEREDAALALLESQFHEYIAPEEMK